MNVQVEHVGKRFTAKGTAAVADATFEAAPDGITTLLGPSGSGKTTVLRIIAGLESADQGRVLVDGIDVTRTPVGKRRFGFVFQTFSLFNQLTVSENIAFGLEAQGLRGVVVRNRVRELIEMVQLDGLGARYPLQLSGGQRQRVGFARALAPHPKLLLLDEPFGALDARVRVEMRHWLRALHDATRIATILVTHDQEEALELSDRIVVMDQGRVHQVGTPRQIYEEPKTSFVASFVGSANVLKGQVKDGRAAVGALSVPVPEGIAEGASVQAIVRPHDVRIAKADPDSVTNETVARIARTVRLGSSMKLLLQLSTGPLVTVILPLRTFDQLGLGPDDLVRVEVDGAQVFREDYVI
jgi:sulfate/thiosulfate transport system ATP-binding protein